MERIAIVVVVFVAACGNSNDGQLGGPCNDDGTCGAGLACISDLCIADLCSEGAADDCMFWLRKYTLPTFTQEVLTELDQRPHAALSDAIVAPVPTNVVQLHPNAEEPMVTA